MLTVLFWYKRDSAPSPSFFRNNVLSDTAASLGFTSSWICRCLDDATMD